MFLTSAPSLGILHLHAWSFLVNRFHGGRCKDSHPVTFKL
jgi:hypothetical protein